jgi:pimeloyl-ACP methyl ester carboxylesterase
MTYVPLTYLEDVQALITALALERFVLFGTSLGGLITMLLAAGGKERIAGALLNDIGPAMESRGLEHIRSYVGRSQNWPTWLHAARYLADAQRDRYPDWELDQWLVYAKRLAKLTPTGRVVFDYDMRIAEPFKQPAGEAGFDLWSVFRALDGIPSLIVHGGISDLLSAETVEKMKAEVPTMESVTVPRVGHAPTLEEPEAVAAIDRLLKRVAAKKR